MILTCCLLLTAASVQTGALMCTPETSSSELVMSRGYDLTGQTHVITGGDSGIGLGIAFGLAQANARVIFLGHNMTKTADVMRDITKHTSNKKLASVPIDLMSFASVKSAVDNILSTETRIDAVICDAGLIHPSSKLVTDDGFESALQIEYISHVFLVELLLPELRKTQGRVVHTSSIGIDAYSVCVKSNLPEDCLKISTLSEVAHKPSQAFGNVSDGNVFMAMWMKTMHARILALKEAKHGITAYSFHPGLVASSGDMDDFYEQYGGKDALIQLCSSSAWPDDFLPGWVHHCQQNPAWQSHVDECRHVPWYLCLCSGPDGKMKSCPLTSVQGGLSGTYLAAAPKSELLYINGAFTAACGFVPLVYGDPYLEMVGNVGADATLSFLQNFYDLSLSWLPTAASTTMDAVSVDWKGKGVAVWIFVCVMAASMLIWTYHLCRKVHSQEPRYFSLE